MSSSNELSVSAIKRIGSDVRDILKNPIDNCFYIHSTKNVNEGYAVVFGADDTPYFGVPMFYKLTFPNDYPHQPPKMLFLSYSSPDSIRRVRMHPNYYTNGKCCLSILNTWSGDKWTGCQTIRSLLLSVSMTLTSDPLENEPGFKNNDEPLYRPIIVNAGMHWLYNYLSNFQSNKPNKKVITFSTDEDEDAALQQQFFNYVVNTYLKNNGELLLKNLKDENSLFNKWVSIIKGYKLHLYSVRVYGLSPIIDFEKTKSNVIPVIEEILKQKKIEK